MHHTVVELGELGIVPAVGGSHQITGDALQLVDGAAATLRAYFQILLSILMTAIHATVAIVVDRAVTDVILVNHVYDVADSVRIVGASPSIST